MEPVYDKGGVQIFHGDCLEVLRCLPDQSVHAVVTDPPAGIGFMGREWDDFRRARNESDIDRDNQFGRLSQRGPEYARRSRDAFVGFIASVMMECLRVLKPVGHMLCWAIPRTSHWTALGIEDAGFEIRDCIYHVFGSGFPKSLSVSVAIDKAAGAERERIRGVRSGVVGDTYAQDAWSREYKDSVLSCEPITEAAKQWNGWGTALKPAVECWWLCRKPLMGTVAENVLTHGTGALNIDACRVEGAPPSVPQPEFNSPTGKVYGYKSGVGRNGEMSNASGRWPANLIHDGSDEVIELFPEASGQQGTVGPQHDSPSTVNTYGGGYGSRAACEPRGDSGSAARFFYCAKSSRSERGPGNNHPTVKPLSLANWLIRLCCPPDGIVLDPFLGSGTTAVAAREEFFKCIGIEREREYIDIAIKRLSQGVLPLSA